MSYRGVMTHRVEAFMAPFRVDLTYSSNTEALSESSIFAKNGSSQPGACETYDSIVQRQMVRHGSGAGSPKSGKESGRIFL